MWNENEPRDQRGRWTTGPTRSGVGGSATAELYAAKKARSQRSRTARGKQATARRYIAQAVDAATKVGVKTQVMSADEAQAVWGDKWDTIQAAYRAKDDVILINSQHPDWASPYNAIEEHRIGWFSTGDFDRVIQHELAHREHAQRIGWRRINELGARKPKYAEEITREVGRYAATSDAEFVAEMRVGMKAGYRYSDMLMDYYTRLGGAK